MLNWIAIFLFFTTTTFAQEPVASPTPATELREATPAESEVILEKLGRKTLEALSKEAYPTLKVRVPRLFDITATERDGKPFFQEIFVSWGFDRCAHSNSDLAFTTNDGNFTILNAVAKDRQSPFSLKLYLFSTVPQYNIDIGVMFNEKWGAEININHMKWVFDNARSYQITGNYNHDVVLSDGSVVPFQEAQNRKDASWIKVEHSDGYNYESISLVRNFNIYRSPRGRFAYDMRVGAGLGFMMPKTKIEIQQDAQGNYIGADNRFHIAGPGAHADIKARLVFFSKFYIQGTSRANVAKLNDVLVDGTSSRLEQVQPVTSIQLIGQIGYIHRFQKKTKKPPGLF